MRQTGNDWLNWRTKGLGSSDAPVVMGVSPWATPYQLWEKKVGVAPDTSGNFATARGTEMESTAREHYELETGYKANAQTFTHPEFDWLRASLDGWVDDQGLVVELKCPGEKPHKIALGGNIPEYYFPQLQHQMLVTGARLAHYYSFDGRDGALIEVPRDPKYIELVLFPELKKFWKLVKAKKPPSLSDRDYMFIEDQATIGLIGQWKVEKATLDQAKSRVDLLKGQITERLKHPRMKFDDVIIFRRHSPGRVSYSKIPELKGVDLSEYTSKPSSSWTIKLK